MHIMCSWNIKQAHSSVEASASGVCCTERYRLEPPPSVPVIFVSILGSPRLDIVTMGTDKERKSPSHIENKINIIYYKSPTAPVSSLY